MPIQTHTQDFLNKSKGQFINGKWVNDKASHILNIIDPSTEEVITTIPEATLSEVSAAVSSSVNAFQLDSPWRRTPPQERERLLHALADAIEENADVLAELTSLEMGAPFGGARFFEVEKVLQTFRYYAGFPTKIKGETIDIGVDMGDGEFFSYTTKEPVGVVGAIVPWNAPLLIGAWKLAPALAAGCTIVLKPSEEACLALLYLAELIHKVGFPEGVVNVIVGRGTSVGQALLKEDGIDKFTFTGSLYVGKLIHAAAADKMIRLSLELGGKSPVIVLPDVNIDEVVPGIAMGVFANSGQVCVAGSKILVHHSIVKEFTEKIVVFAKSLKLGSGFEETTQIGPVVSKKQYDRVNNYLNIAKSEGATMYNTNNYPEKGYFIPPTVITGLPNSSKLLKEEIFGPVLTIETYEDVNTVVKEANNDVYGLAAMIWGTSHKEIQQVAKKLRVGSIFINTAAFPPAGISTGGFRQSGKGRDLGETGLEGFLESKSVISRMN